MDWLGGIVGVEEVIHSCTPRRLDQRKWDQLVRAVSRQAGRSHLCDQQVIVLVLGRVDGRRGRAVVGGDVAELAGGERIGGRAVVHALLELWSHKCCAGDNALQVHQLGQELQTKQADSCMGSGRCSGT